MEYRNDEYWGRLHDRDDLSAVGQSALSDQVNTWLYRTTRRNLRRFARRHGLQAAGGGRLLEIGVGTGYWVAFWQSMKWSVDGTDLVPVAVDRLHAAHPDARFWVADVSRPGGLVGPEGPESRAGGEYDLVTATNVLLHVTEDAAFDHALRNVADLVGPGGRLLLVEPVLTLTDKQAPFDPAKHSRARILASYVEPLQQAGLELKTIEATTVLSANPLEATTPKRMAQYRRWWNLVTASKKKPGRMRWLGPVMYVADGALIRTKEAPTSKIMLFQRSA